MNNEGLIGVEPILFNKDEFLNSKNIWGIEDNVIDIGDIANEPANICVYPKIDPKITIKINGKIKAKKGPKKFFQKDSFINLNKGFVPLKKPKNCLGKVEIFKVDII